LSATNLPGAGNTINIFSPSAFSYNNQKNKSSHNNNNSIHSQVNMNASALPSPVGTGGTPWVFDTSKAQLPKDSNKIRTSNIKVVARFRPLNKMELELIQNGLGQESVVFPDEKSVAILPDSQVFTFDKVFTGTSTQEQIYAVMGKENIDDVLNGYNGTIFTYGQTSSGKTYTMYGNMYDDGLQGIVPRAMKQIFEFIQNVDFEVDFVLSCSMLEIYKETLYDLLNPERTMDLKIKESPRRGIYVEGLTQISVVSEEELMEVLEIGDRAKTVAATRINQFSSRSHTIFVMEIIQRFPNEAEKSGKLNLVDLAGSEKVGKTGAVGETLEEAKKINLSLSCLGNVIHALTTNCDHIPYRDSKLTRILQESLGGNFKTSLIVTCSPHSSNREETISSLKFATRAKSIKNHFKMNIHNSPEALLAIIEQLRLELDECKGELSRYRGEVFDRNRTNGPYIRRAEGDGGTSTPGLLSYMSLGHNSGNAGASTTQLVHHAASGSSYSNPALALANNNAGGSGSGFTNNLNASSSPNFQAHKMSSSSKNYSKFRSGNPKLDGVDTLHKDDSELMLRGLPDSPGINMETEFASPMKALESSRNKQSGGGKGNKDLGLTLQQTEKYEFFDTGSSGGEILNKARMNLNNTSARAGSGNGNSDQYARESYEQGSGVVGGASGVLAVTGKSGNHGEQAKSSMQKRGGAGATITSTEQMSGKTNLKGKNPNGPGKMALNVDDSSINNILTNNLQLGNNGSATEYKVDPTTGQKVRIPSNTASGSYGTPGFNPNTSDTVIISAQKRPGGGNDYRDYNDMEDNSVGGVNSSKGIKGRPKGSANNNNNNSDYRDYNDNDDNNTMNGVNSGKGIKGRPKNAMGGPGNDYRDYNDNDDNMPGGVNQSKGIKGRPNNAVNEYRGGYYENEIVDPVTGMVTQGGKGVRSKQTRAFTNYDGGKGMDDLQITITPGQVDINMRKQYNNTYTYFKTNLELINQNEILEMRVGSLKGEVENLRGSLGDKEKMIQLQDEEIMTLKNSLLQMENKYSGLTEEKQLATLKFSTQNESGEHLRLTNKVLEREVAALTEALTNCEQSIQNLLKEKARLIQQKFLDCIKDSLEFNEIKLPDYFKHSFNFNYEPFYNQVRTDKGVPTSSREETTEQNIGLSNEGQFFSTFKESFISNLDFQAAFSNASNNFKGMVEVPYKTNLILNQNSYGSSVKEAIMDEAQISPELMIYFLRHQLLQTCVMNKHLERTIAALEWKQIIEYGKAKIKSNFTLMQEKHIANLEKVLEKAKISHQQLRNRVEAVELDAIKLREAISTTTRDYRRSPTHSGSKARILKSFTREMTKKMRKIREENEISLQSGRMQTETDDMDVFQIRKSEKAFSFVVSPDKRFDSPRNNEVFNNISAFLKELDKEHSVASGTPNCFDEAKIMLNIKNVVIDKLKKYLIEIQFHSGFAMVDFAGGSNYDALRSEKERLENKILILQSELDLESTRSEQLKEAYLETNKQIRNLKKLSEEMEIASRNALKLENESWQKVVDELKSLNEKEIIRKQEEVTKLHDLLAGWVFRYMELQEQKGITPSQPEKILFETFKRKEIPDSRLFEKALRPSKNNKMDESTHKMNRKSYETTHNTPSETITLPPKKP
jgi:hypothetical protein